MSVRFLEGRRRLRLALRIAAPGGLLAMMALVLIIYGRPYNPLWWVAMAAIIVASFLLAGPVARLVEWVVAGYLEADDGRGP